MLKRWIFLNNPFLTATEGSFEKALTVSTFTDSRLAATPALAAAYAFYHPLHEALLNAYNKWKLGGGQQKTSTATVKSLLQGLTAALNDWDFAIQSFARKGTPQYLTFFPRGHTPFLKGKQDARIAAVSTLSAALATITPTPAIKPQVDAYLTALHNANGQQEGRKGGTNSLSMAVEKARVTACNGLYSVLGQLMAIHYADTDQIATFFQLETIRRRKHYDFTGAIAAGTTKKIAKRGLESDDIILLKNTGPVPLTFYLGRGKTAHHQPDSPSVTIGAGQHQSVPASALGNVETDKYLMVHNASELTDGHWEVEI